MADAVSLKRPAEVDVETEPVAKQVKLDETATIKKQIEYYLCDLNLKGDKFFYDKIKENQDGWLDITHVLNCKKIKALNVDAARIAEAIQASVDVEMKEDNSAIRRKDNKALPAFEGRQGGSRKPIRDPATITSSCDFGNDLHKAGVILRFPDVPSEVQFLDIKADLKKYITEHEELKAQKIFCSYCSTKKQEGEKTGALGSAAEGEKVVESVYVGVTQFPEDIAFFKNMKSVKVVSGKETEEQKDHDLPLEVIVNPAALDKICEGMPQDLREKRKKFVVSKQRAGNAKGAGKQKKLQIGQFSFQGIRELKGRVREIQTARSDGEELKKTGSDFQLIAELLKWHPRCAEKTKNMAGIKIDQSPHGGNRCFFIVKEDGTAEDFSIMKIMAQVEARPMNMNSGKGAQQNEPEKKEEVAVEEKKEADMEVEPVSEKQEEPVSEKKEEPVSEKKEEPVSEKKEEPVSEKKEDAKDVATEETKDE